MKMVPPIVNAVPSVVGNAYQQRKPSISSAASNITSPSFGEMDNASVLTERSGASSKRSSKSKRSVRSKMKQQEEEAAPTFEFKCDQISTVISSWELVRRKHGGEDLGCEILLRLFDLEPKIRTAFGLPVDGDLRNNGLKRMAVLVHAIHAMQVFDGIMSLVGPDTNELKRVLVKFTKQYLKDNFQAYYVPYIGKAILDVFEDLLGDQWTKEMEKAWVHFFLPVAEIVMGVIVEMQQSAK